MEHIEVTDASQALVARPTLEVEQPMSYGGIWLTPGVYLTEKIAPHPFVRFIGEKVERDYTQVLVLVEDDPDELLNTIFETEREMYIKFKGHRFDVRVQVVDKDVDLTVFKKAFFQLYERGVISDTKVF